MEFSFSREQDDLRSSVRDVLQRRSGSEARHRVLAQSARNVDRDLWATITQELDLVGLAVSEERGGSGAGLLETCIVLEELGHDLSAVPYFSSVAASWVLVHAEEAGAELLADVIDGSRVLTLALLDEGGSWSAPGRTTRATRVGAVHRLRGRKRMVTDGDVAGGFVVHAQLPAGAAWFHVDADAPGVTVETTESLDLTRPVAHVTLHDAPARLLVDHRAAPPILAEVNDRAAVALAAEMVGGAQAALDHAVAWSLERQQFGRPIGSFQAIKHLCADTLVEIETARVLTHFAAHAIDAGLPDASVAASMAKHTASDAFSLASTNSIQVHGGIGFTWEHSAHLYVRRAKSASALYGTPHQHRERLAGLLLGS